MFLDALASTIFKAIGYGINAMHICAKCFWNGFASIIFKAIGCSINATDISANCFWMHCLVSFIRLWVMV